MNCNEALQIMLEPGNSRRQVALDYIINHPACLARVDQLVRAVTAAAEDELSCAEAQVQLADYYTRQEQQHDADAHFPLLHSHLDRCPYCQIEYAALAKTMTALAAGALPVIVAPKPFNLDFLDELPPVWTINGAVHRLFQNITVTITKTKAVIESLTPQLTPTRTPLSFALSTAMRGKDDLQYTILTIPDETAEMRFHFDIKPTATGMADVTLSITNSTTNQPIPDVRIALQKADGTPVTRSLTDNAGKLALPQMRADDYIIQAKNENGLWEIPITIVTQ